MSERADHGLDVDCIECHVLRGQITRVFTIRRQRQQNGGAAVLVVPVDIFGPVRSLHDGLPLREGEQSQARVQNVDEGRV